MKENDNTYKKEGGGVGGVEIIIPVDLELPRWGRLPLASFSSHFYRFFYRLS